jgi:hypothetical protein
LEDIYFAIRNSPKSYDDFNNYMIISLAKRLGIKIFTYDEKMKRNKKVKPLLTITMSFDTYQDG